MQLRKLLTGASVGALATGLLLGGTGAAGAAQQASTSAVAHRAHPATVSATLNALYRKAVAARQTSVVIYGPSAGTDTALYKAFQKQFPKIAVTGVPVVGPPMSAKLGAEFSSGKHVADIAYTGSTDMLIYATSHWLVPFTPATAPPVAKLPRGNVGPNRTFYGTSTAPFGTIYNTAAVKASQVPKTWQDFLKPQWKGKIGIGDPTSIGEMADVFAHLARVRTMAGYMAKLHAQNVELYPATEITGPLTAVAQGGKALGIEEGYAFYLAAKHAGAPIGFSLLKAYNYTTTLYMGQLKGAPHPLAARLYEDWLYTLQAEKVIAAGGDYSPVAGAPAPAGLPTLAKLPQMPYIALSDIPAADNAAIAAAKKLWG